MLLLGEMEAPSLGRGLGERLVPDWFVEGDLVSTAEEIRKTSLVGGVVTVTVMVGRLRI